MKLRRKFMADVCAGKDVYMLLGTTATGTGLAAGNRVGMCILDISANDWFLCTVSTGAGTWVKVYG